MQVGQEKMSARKGKGTQQSRGTPTESPAHDTPQHRDTQGTPKSQGLPGPQRVSYSSSWRITVGTTGAESSRGGGNRQSPNLRPSGPTWLGGHFHRPQVSGPHSAGQPWAVQGQKWKRNSGYIRAHLGPTTSLSGLEANNGTWSWEKSPGQGSQIPTAAFAKM